MCATVDGCLKLTLDALGNDNTLFHKHKGIIMVAKIVIFVDIMRFYVNFNNMLIKPSRDASV